MADQYIHQLSAYYGIFYSQSIRGEIIDILKTSKKFAGLAEDPDGEIEINDNLLFISTNSDRDETETVYFIAVDDMTIGGPDFHNSDDLYFRIEPREMIKYETTYKHAVEIVTDLYEIIVKQLKYKKISLNNIHMGWNVFPCTWDVKNIL